jgi:hypothetical protein
MSTGKAKTANAPGSDPSYRKRISNSFKKLIGRASLGDPSPTPSPPGTSSPSSIPITTLSQATPDVLNAAPVAQSQPVALSRDGAYEAMISPDLRFLSSGGPQSASDRLWDASKTAWDAFRSGLKIAKEASDWNPFVKAALGGLVALLEYVDVSISATHAQSNPLMNFVQSVEDAHVDFLDLQQKVRAFTTILQTHRSSAHSTSLGFRDRLESLAR